MILSVRDYVLIKLSSHVHQYARYGILAWQRPLPHPALPLGQPLRYS